MIAPQHFHLLKAALWPPQEALTFWRKWVAERKFEASILENPNVLPLLFDPVDAASQQLLPFVAQHLQHTDDPFVQKLKGNIRHHWLSNQYSLNQAQQICKIFQSINGQTLVLKNMAMSKGYYQNLEIQFSRDLDIAVRGIDRQTVIDTLTATPFNLTLSAVEKSQIEYASFTRFYDATTKKAVNIHWHLFQEYPSAGVDDLFWQNTSTLDLGAGVVSQVLRPIYQLFYTLVHGLYKPAHLSVSWVADAVFLIKNEKIDWSVILDLTKKLKYATAFQAALPLLKTEFGADISDEVCTKMASLPSSKAERCYFEQAITFTKPRDVIGYGQRNFWLYEAYLKYHSKTQKPFLVWFLSKVLKRLLA
ncbi:MAG: nucleotidyltransferase family protein [Spirosomaceae bacterium]|nr:nucleotidyltransferase family protein [Spirosomataceae bacterium]